MTTETRSLYSQLPAIDRLLRDSSFLSLRDTYGHTRVVELLRQMLDEAREVIRDSQTLPAWCENWAQEVDARLTKEAQSALRPVIKSEANEIREGRFCKRCGEKLEYRFYHYSQLG